MTEPLLAQLPLSALFTKGGFPLFVVFGIVVELLLFWQLATGLRWIKVNFKVHKVSGISALVLLALHVPFGFQAVGIWGK